MFESPQEMTSMYMRDLEMKYKKQELIEDTIRHYKKDAFNKMDEIIDVFYVEAIALTIASGYENEDESAIEIVNRLSLNDKHIYAILNDYERIEEILNEEAKQDQQYEDYEE